MDFWQTLGLNSDILHSLQEVLIVLGIGLLLGLEREMSKGGPDVPIFAGVRTFPIVTLTGYVAMLLAAEYSVWIFVGTLFGAAALIAMSYVGSKAEQLGTTTEFSLLIAFLLGGLVFTGRYHLAVSVAVAVAALLSLKDPLHQAVQRLSQKDVHSILFFLVITALALPLLPNIDMGPYGIFNLFRIWLIVVIFVALNFLGYFLTKFLDQKKSTLLTGILGGFVSSTATAWFFSRQSRKNQEGGVIEAAAIVLASSIMFPRLLIWLLLLNFELFRSLWIPIVVLGLMGIGIGYWISRRHGAVAEGPPKEVKNPINLREALFFGVIYLGIQFIVGYANEHFGESGVYVASGISGMTDIDAIAISMARFGKEAPGIGIAGTAIVIAALTNTLVKYGFCLVFGNRNLKRYSSLAFLPIFALGVGYIIFRMVS